MAVDDAFGPSAGRPHPNTQGLPGSCPFAGDGAGDRRLLVPEIALSTRARPGAGFPASLARAGQGLYKVSMKTDHHKRRRTWALAGAADRG
jgi:hypothetical protein